MTIRLPTCMLLATSLWLCACSPAPQSDSLLALEIRVAELEAREAIRTLFTDYGRTLDNRDYRAFAALYTNDAEYHGGGGQVARGAEAIASQLESVISANASGANLHVYTNEKIEVDVAAGTATATSRGAFYVENDSGGPMPLMWATYEDVLARVDEQWKFRSRRVIGDLPGASNESRAGMSPAGS